ncbi:MAG: hypothetical protein ACRDT0_13615 [Pseudonocardiaceae bacterium]
MRRREAIGLAAKIAVGASLTTADRAMLDAQVGASPAPARIGASDVALVEAMTRALMAQDKAMGGGSCRDAVLGHLTWAQQLCGAAASDTVQRGLHAALARLESLAGWTSADLCLPLSAQRCYLRSLESARLAGQPLLAAHALGRLGELYLQAGHIREALQIVSLGVIPAQEAASPGGSRASPSTRHGRTPASATPTRCSARCATPGSTATGPSRHPTSGSSAPSCCPTSPSCPPAAQTPTPSSPAISRTLPRTRSRR